MVADAEFICETCSKKFKYLRNYNVHQKLHKYLPNCSFKCLEQGCYKQFKSYKTFYMHIYRNHEIKRNKGIPEITRCRVINCPYKIESKRDLSRHISQHIIGGQEMNCPFEICKATGTIYRNISTWRSHLFRKHYDMNVASAGVNDMHDSDDFTETSIEDDVFNLSYSENEASDDNDFYTKSVSTLYLTLQSKYFLTDRALTAVIQGINDMNEISNENLKKTLKLNYNINISDDALKNSNLFTCAHGPQGDLRTPYLRKKYYKKNFNYVAPTCVFLGSHKNKQKSFFYVPILESLKVLLQNEHVLKCCLMPEENNDQNVLSSISDGSAIKTNRFFNNHPANLRVIMFQDAFELCNPLGSSKNKHKTVGIYMILGNLPTYCWSRVDNISLVALVKEVDVKYFGISTIFDIIVKDLKKLETSGINVGEHTFKGSLFAMLGDNLGSHQIGGFSENFSKASYICRYCYTEKKDFNVKMEAFKMRSAETYELDLELKSITDENHYKGVKSNSVLNSLTNFHVCASGLPPCLAHDIFEGVVQYDMMLALHDLIKKNYFTLEILNNRFNSLKVKGASTHFPLFKEKCEKLPGSAHENLLMLQLVPFAISNLISNCQDSTWQMILLLRKISNVILSIKVSTCQVLYLKDLIVNYMKIRQQLFPDVNLRPKHHYMLHYPHLTLKFGPLKHLWTLRFESKHKYFKNIVKHCPNFRNVLFSLSEKHQMLQALHASQPSVYEDKIEAVNVVRFENKYHSLEFCNLVEEHFQIKQTLFLSKHVSYRSIDYVENCFLCNGKDHYGDYSIIELHYNVIDKNYKKLLFIGKSFIISYDDFSGLYIRKTKDEKLVSCAHAELLLNEPLYYSSIDEQVFFYFKSEPFCENY